MQSVWNSPNPILFGRGSAKAVGDKLREFGCKKVLVVYDEGVASIADTVIGYIESADIGVVRFAEVQADPPDWLVEKAGALGASKKVDGVVGVGGGSSLDAAKAAKLLITNPPPIKQYYGREGVVMKPSVPLIVMPTTAGTGSEATPGGVITDTERGIKTNIAGIGCAVTLGIVDPELTVGMPASITAITGMDALSHCLESYTSARKNDLSAVVGREGIRLVAKYLVRAVEDGSDMEAREGMMFASVLGGMAMSGALCHLSHDIGRSLGAKFQVPHGIGCAVCMPQVLETVAELRTDELRYIAECFGAELPADADAKAVGQAVYKAVQTLIKRIKLPTMRDMGLTLDDILSKVPDEVVMQCEMAAKAGFVTSPVPVTKVLITNILTKAYNEN